MIRDRQPADLEECVAVLRQVHATDNYPKHWPADPVAWLSRPGRGWVAAPDTHVAGHVSVTADGELSRLFVAPDHRGRGIAAALVTTARRHGATWLEVVAGRATGFYERLGWSRTGEVQASWDPSVTLWRYHA